MKCQLCFSLFSWQSANLQSLFVRFTSSQAVIWTRSDRGHVLLQAEVQLFVQTDKSMSWPVTIQEWTLLSGSWICVGAPWSFFTRSFLNSSMNLRKSNVLLVRIAFMKNTIKAPTVFFFPSDASLPFLRLSSVFVLFPAAQQVFPKGCVCHTPCAPLQQDLKIHSLHLPCSAPTCRWTCLWRHALAFPLQERKKTKTLHHTTLMTQAVSPDESSRRRKISGSAVSRQMH